MKEGGTPDIIGSIRAALAFMVKDEISRTNACFSYNTWHTIKVSLQLQQI